MSSTPVTLGEKTGKKLVLKASLLQPYLVTIPTAERKTSSTVLKLLTRFFESHPEVKKVQSAGRKKRKISGEIKQPNEFRKNFVFGINEVTKALEKDKLSFFITCKSAKPAALTQHLALLSASRGTPTAGLANLSATLAPLLELKSVLALGFLKTEDPSDVAKTATDIKQHLSTITLPWNTLLPEKCPVKQSTVSEENPHFLQTKVCINKSSGRAKRQRN
uniref:ribonuclease P protein subunit p38-like n=1 Tax=Ciona intestinalis TaxID=7719 RepID=UPI000180C460|nr:ribonuclease P protein subunit p38-like [Ciona intestinalis]|eukprot:XP_009861415.1 ribonuclease P protein subunit p38-like [Ciona intestinalis]